MGEQATTKVVQSRRRRKQGWRIVHGLYFDGHGDMHQDHVLVGPDGIFILESKWTNVPWERSTSILPARYPRQSITADVAFAECHTDLALVDSIASQLPESSASTELVGTGFEDLLIGSWDALVAVACELLRLPQNTSLTHDVIAEIALRYLGEVQQAGWGLPMAPP